MSHPPPQKLSMRWLCILGVFAVAIALAFSLPVYSQVSPEDHAKHHPGADKEKDKAGPGMAGGDKGAGMKGGMGGDKGGGMMGGGMDMDGMMKKMGVPPPRELYPSLMSLPELTAEEREKVGSQAQERMHKGVKLMSEGLDRLAKEAENKNYAIMQEATAEVREGLAQFESGLAAHRALTEGKPPRQVALQWFKSEMSLQPPQGVEANSSSSGLSALHYFIMALLIAFALAMLAMYYFKMRRAAALFGRLDEPDSKSPPPGSSPPPKEGGGPSPAPPPEKTSPAPATGAAAPTPAAPGDAPSAPAEEKASPAPAAADAVPAAPAVAKAPPALEAGVSPGPGPSKNGTPAGPPAGGATPAPAAALDPVAGASPAPGPSKNGTPAGPPAGAATHDPAPVAGASPVPSASKNGTPAGLPGKGPAPEAPAAATAGKWSGKLRIAKILEETPNVKTFRLMDPLGGEVPFSFQPGQYLALTVLPEGKPVKRSYTIASSPTEHAYVDLTINREEKGGESRYLHDRAHEGDLLDFAGPSGSFVFTGRESKGLVFIAVGEGITPMMSAIRYLTDRSWPDDIYLLYGCETPQDFIFREEVEYLQRQHPNLHVVVIVSSAKGTNWKGPTGRITKRLITKSVPEISKRRVHICGPKEMMDATKKILAELGVPKEQIKSEPFGPSTGRPNPEPKPAGGSAAAPAAEANPDVTKPPASAPSAAAEPPATPAAGAAAPTPTVPSAAPPGGRDPPPDANGPPPGGKKPPSGGPPPAPGAAASPSPTTTEASTQSPERNGAAGPKANLVPPLTAKWRGQLVIESITRETPDIKTFRFRSPGGGTLPFTYLPGQFLNVALSIGGARMNRSYSISSSPHERAYVELSVKREERGAVSRHIVDLWKVGETIEAGGPVGKLTFTGSEADSVVLISAGIGITPMMSVARYLSEQSWPGDIFFIFTVRRPADFIFEKALAALANRNPKLHLTVTMTKPGPYWKGPRGRMTKELLAQSVPDIASRRIHLCGPLPMMEATKAFLSELGVASDHVKAEAFGAVKPPLAGPNDPAKPKIAPTGPVVTFSKNNKSAKIGIDQTGEQAALATGPGQTILELSEELAIGIENSCRVGTCGICKVKMTSGEVDQAVQDALDDDDKKNGIILACQAKPKTPVTVEA